jgi:hypothetical protein
LEGVCCSQTRRDRAQQGETYSCDEGLMTNINPAAKIAVMIAAVGKRIIPKENMFNKYYKSSQKRS